MEKAPVRRHPVHQGTLFLSIALLLSGCGGGSGTDGADDETNFSATGTENSLAQQAVDSIYHDRRTPDGFYTETAAPPGVFQTITHIKNTDVLAPGSFTSATARYELCTDDFSEALDWSNTAAASLGSLVDNTATDLYFQFTRSPPSDPSSSNLQRVYKCSLLDRSMLDIRNLGDQLGHYSQTPQSGERLQQLLEYLWTFSSANNYGNAVLSSTLLEQDDRYQVGFEQARLTIGGANTCDRIDIVLTTYQILKADGVINVQETPLQTVNARFDGFNILFCSS